MTGELRERILELRARGWFYWQIAEEMGISTTTVFRVCSPLGAQRGRETSRAWKDRNREANRRRDRLYYRERRLRRRRVEPSGTPFDQFVREMAS